MEAYYNIHNIVGVKIKTENSRIVKEYEYVLRNFKILTELKNINIEILDFKEFHFPENHFYLSSFFNGFNDGVYHKKDHYALEIKDNKIKLYLKDADVSLNPLIEYFLLKNGSTFVHGAGISYKDKGIIFPAPPGAGKTLLISKLRENKDIKFFGDDYLILNQNTTMYSYPIDFSIYDYHFNFFPELQNTVESRKIKKVRYERPIVNIIKDLPFKKFLKKVAYFFQYDFLKGGEYVKIPVKQLIPESKIGQSAVLRHSIFLKRYNGTELKIEKMELEGLVKELLGILQSEWRETMPIFYALSSAGVIDATDYLNNIKNIMTKSFSNLELYRILIPQSMDNREYLQKIEEFLEQKIFTS